MSKHTPGPWEVSHLNARRVRAAESQNLVAETEDVADAQLIAVAPDMLRLLKAWLRRARAVGLAGHVKDCGCIACETDILVSNLAKKIL